ncbi:VWA domain-containing protein [soil metagenome]
MSLSFLAPQFLWALLAIPVVVLLHFIRARKKRYEVSALFLWKQAQDIAAARRRFSPSLLLLLQLAFVTLAALALAQPSLSLSGPPDRVLVVDASASMAARDPDGVRLAKAVTEAKTLVRGAGRVAVVRAGLGATVVQGLTTDLTAVDRALDGFNAADREADLGRALSLALSIAPDAEVHLFTDTEPPPGNRAAVHGVGGDGLNVGISTFDIGLQQAFVAVVSNHPRPQEVGLELSQDGVVVAQTTLLVPAAGQANASFPLGSASGFFEARVLTPDWDALALDDTAYAGKRDLRVVLNASDDAVERALSAIPNLSYQVLPNAALNAPGFGARVLIGGSLDGLSEGNYLLFAAPVAEPVYKTVRTWDRSDPLLRFVDLSGAVVGLSDLSSEPAPPIPEGWQTLAQTADLTPVILREQGPNLNVVAANFNPSQTDLVNRSAFPLFVTNVMNAFRDETPLLLGEPLPVGTTLLLGGRTVSRSQATEPGLYTLNGQTYTASLLSSTESRLAAFTAVAVAAEPEQPSQRVRSAALWLVALAAALLVGEWLLWSRGRRRPWRPRWLRF